MLAQQWRPCGSGLKGGCLVGLFLMAHHPPFGDLLFCAWIYGIVNAELHSCNCLLELVVVAYCAFCVDDHSRRHKPHTGAHGKIQPDFRLINCELGSLHALRQVRLSDGVFDQGQELCLGLFRSSAFSKNAASNVHLRDQYAVNECFD